MLVHLKIGKRRQFYTFATVDTGDVKKVRKEVFEREGERKMLGAEDESEQKFIKHLRDNFVKQEPHIKVFVPKVYASKVNSKMEYQIVGYIYRNGQI